MSDISLVFFGTGPISLATLEQVAESFAIEAVVTKADSINPAGKTIESPVKLWAKDHHVPVFQPRKKTELAELFDQQTFASQVGLVVDYGLIIPKSVIDSFPKGIINSHFSMLPQWRGADPITTAILSGADQTGVSLMIINEGMDTGELIAQEHYEIPTNITIHELETALVKLSNKLIQQVLPRYFNGEIMAWQQDNSIEPSYTKKLSKDDGLIDWAKEAAVLEREIRAYLGWPGSYTTLASKPVIITQAHVLDYPNAKPSLAFKHDKQFAVQCGKNALIIDRLKPAGKREMTGQEFLAGHPML